VKKRAEESARDWLCGSERRMCGEGGARTIDIEISGCAPGRGMLFIQRVVWGNENYPNSAEDLAAERPFVDLKILPPRKAGANRPIAVALLVAI
jgi:hypothetical protein